MLLGTMMMSPHKKRSRPEISVALLTRAMDEDVSRLVASYLEQNDIIRAGTVTQTQGPFSLFLHAMDRLNFHDLIVQQEQQ